MQLPNQSNHTVHGFKSTKNVLFFMFIQFYHMLQNLGGGGGIRLTFKLYSKILKTIIMVITSCGRRGCCRELFGQLHIRPLQSRHIFTVLLILTLYTLSSDRSI